MARNIHSRYKITGNLIAQSPLHVGGVEGNQDTDLALAVNGQGKYYIPGTSLAGALRAWMQRIDPKITDKLWGFQGREDQGHASFVVVKDAVINSTPIVEIRDGVAIDRESGTAAEGMKYDRMILPKGVTISLNLVLERDGQLSETQWLQYQSYFAQLIAALEDGEIYLGAAKTRGLGRVKLYDVKIQEQQLLNREGILDTLLTEGTVVNWSRLCSSNNSSLAKLGVKIHWKPCGPVMVKSEGDGIAVDILPLVSGCHGSVTFVLPGSSLKGVWRSQAERIVRTVTAQHLTEKFADQVKLDLVKQLFGAAAELDNNEEQLGRLGSLGVDDCYANIPITPQEWAGVTSATDEGQLRQALNPKLKDTQQAFHVAIDRWTGGAADGFLYSVLEPMGVSWQPIELTLNLDRLQQKDDKEKETYYPSLALFLLVLRDFMSNRLPIGFGTNRGMGAIEVEKVEIRGTGDLDQLQPMKEITLSKDDLSAIDRNLITMLNQQWQEWIEHSGGNN